MWSRIRKREKKRGGGTWKRKKEKGKKKWEEESVKRPNKKSHWINQRNVDICFKMNTMSCEHDDPEGGGEEKPKR